MEMLDHTAGRRMARVDLPWSRLVNAARLVYGLWVTKLLRTPPRRV
jgi:hypothetical protein